MSDKFILHHQDDEPIPENDGLVPTWFNILFIGGLIIGTIYGVWYHATNQSQAKDYQAEIKSFELLQPKSVAVTLTPEGVNPLRADAAAIEEGKNLFGSFCASCHNADAKGKIGPDLTDAKWYHGGTDQLVYTTIMEGVAFENSKHEPKSIMPAQKQAVGAKKVLQIMAWLASINSDLKSK